MALETLDARNLYDLAYDAIKDAIVSGKLPPETRLSQDELAAQLGVSRAPVRDALNRLEAEGFVQILNRKGVVVAGLEASQLLDIFRIRLLVESYAASQACERMGEGELWQLQQIVDRTAELTESGELHELVQAHTDFHQLSYTVCGNAELNRIARNLWDRSYRYRAMGLGHKEVAVSSLADHRAILECFRQRDCARVEKLVAQHIQSAIDRLLRQMLAPSKDAEPPSLNPPTCVGCRSSRVRFRISRT